MLTGVTDRAGDESNGPGSGDAGAAGDLGLGSGDWEKPGELG